MCIEVRLLPDPTGKMKQSTEEVSLNEGLVDINGTTELFKHLLPIPFTTWPVYKNIPRNKMDGLLISFTLCLRKSYYASTMAVASINTTLSSAIRMVVPRTLYLEHTSEFLSHWRQVSTTSVTPLPQGE